MEQNAAQRRAEAPLYFPKPASCTMGTTKSLTLVKMHRGEYAGRRQFRLLPTIWQSNQVYM